MSDLAYLLVLAQLLVDLLAGHLKGLVLGGDGLYWLALGAARPVTRFWAVDPVIVHLDCVFFSIRMF